MTAKVYFSSALVLFVAAFLLLPTSKMVNNFYYIFIAIPGLFLLLKNYGMLKPTNITEWAIYLICVYIAAYSFFVYPKAVMHALYVIVFVFIVSRFIDEDFFDSKVFARLIFWGSLLYAAVCAINFYAIDNAEFGMRLNPGVSRLYSPIHISMFIACSLFVIGPHWLKDRNYFEGVVGFLLSVLAIALIFQSRTGLVGMGLWVFFILFCIIKNFDIKELFSVAMGLLMVVAVSLPLFDLAGQSSELIERADSYRLDIWRGYLMAWYNCNILFGCGFPEIASVHLVWQPDGSEVFITHNILVNLLYHYGLISLLIFFMMILSGLHLALKQKNWWGGYLLAGVITLMFDGNRIINNPDVVWLMMWLPIGLILARNWHSEKRIISGTHRLKTVDK